MDRKELISGLACIVAALPFAALSLFDLNLGTLARMGPGYFPLMVSILLAGMGMLLITGAMKKAEHDWTFVPWRSFLLIAAAPIVFGLTIRSLGMIPSVALTTAVAGMASTRTNVVAMLAVALLLSIFCVGVFHYGIGMSVPLIRYPGG